MMELMYQGGYMMWVILAATLLILGLAGWAGVRTAKLSGPNAMVETAIDAVLFWGVWVVVIGLLGTFVGTEAVSPRRQRGRHIDRLSRPSARTGR